jgi:hypothetical protein
MNFGVLPDVRESGHCFVCAAGKRLMQRQIFSIFIAGLKRALDHMANLQRVSQILVNYWGNLQEGARSQREDCTAGHHR